LPHAALEPLDAVLEMTDGKARALDGLAFPCRQADAGSHAWELTRLMCGSTLCFAGAALAAGGAAARPMSPAEVRRNRGKPRGDNGSMKLLWNTREDDMTGRY